MCVVDIHGIYTLLYINLQVLEAELLIPLCLAGKNTKIALAGDDMQVSLLFTFPDRTHIE